MRRYSRVCVLQIVMLIGQSIGHRVRSEQCYQHRHRARNTDTMSERVSIGKQTCTVSSTVCNIGIECVLMARGCTHRGFCAGVPCLGLGRVEEWVNGWTTAGVAQLQ